MTHKLFRNQLFKVQVFGAFKDFHFFSNLISLGLQNTFCKISVFEKLLRLCLNRWPSFMHIGGEECVPCIYWMACLWMPIKLKWWGMFKSPVSYTYCGLLFHQLLRGSYSLHVWPWVCRFSFQLLPHMLHLV